MLIETNCFRINGLEELTAKYRLYQISGLHRDSPEYYSNIQKIVRKLSFQMEAPVTTYDGDDETFLVIPAGAREAPTHVPLVRTVALLIDTGDNLNLDFTSDRAELNPVRLRFLQFLFQAPLRQNSRLWQPGAGKPFFFKRPQQEFGEVDLYEGLATRVVQHPEGGFGVMVDLRRKLVSRLPLPVSPTREQVNELKGRSCLYKMGNRWFEISIAGLADPKIKDPSILFEGKLVSLIHYLNTMSSKPVPSSIANLPLDGAAISYRTNRLEQRSAPTSLCYLVQDTHAQNGAGHHHETIIEPY
jgi:hypothetical protein